MIFLITQADLSDYTRMSANIDALLVKPAIRDAHTFDVLPLLSAAELTSLVAYLALDETGRAAHAAHVLYTTAVRPLLCYEAYRRYLLDAGVHLTPNGPEVISEVGHQPLTTAQRTEMRSDAQAKCSHYRAVLLGALRTYRGPAASTACGTTSRRPSRGGLTTSAI